VPGGGVNNDESLEDAIRREVYEEVGIKEEKIEPIGTFQNIHEYKHDTVTVYKMNVQNKTVTIDNSEIESYQWFELSNLPAQQTCTKTLLNILKYLY
jgi:8-oxo-dGTP diphosphatase